MVLRCWPCRAGSGFPRRYRRPTRPRSATPRATLDLRALGGLAFPVGPWPAFLDAQGAYRLRSGGAPAEWHADLTFGVRPLPRLLLLLQSDTTLPVGPGTAWFPASLYSKLGVSLVYDLSARWSVQIGAFSTIAGTNALRERGVLSALWYRF